MSKDSEQKTGHLNLPGAEPMRGRSEAPAGESSAESWELLVIIGEDTMRLTISTPHIVGRFVEGDDPSIPMLDLAPFDGYQNGISRRHAMIICQGNFFYIEDQGSTNGTRINGFQLTPRRKYRLNDGDRVAFSRLETVFRLVRTG